MTKHRSELLRELDIYIGDLLERQLTDAGDPRYGGFWTDAFHVEPRQSGFFLGDMMAAYCTEDSRWYLYDRLADAIRADLTYMENHQRPDGCFDLTPCNYASPPDTAFMMNAVLCGWGLLEKCRAPEADFMRQRVYRLIDSTSRGIAAGGFHTPNHRWAISACLLCCEKITGNKALGERAREYLAASSDDSH